MVITTKIDYKARLEIWQRLFILAASFGNGVLRLLLNHDMKGLGIQRNRKFTNTTVDK